jgi:hypothetical protein
MKKFITYSLIFAIILSTLLAPSSFFEKIGISSSGSLGMGSAVAADIAASTVGTSTNNSFGPSGYFHMQFYAKNRIWIFYSDGTNEGYRTSLDGITCFGVFSVCSYIHIGTS